MIYDTTIDCGMLGELPMIVYFDFHKGSKGDYETPDEPASVEIYQCDVVYNGQVIDFFGKLSENDNYMDDIAFECLEYVEAEAEEAKHGHE